MLFRICPFLPLPSAECSPHIFCLTIVGFKVLAGPSWGIRWERTGDKSAMAPCPEMCGNSYRDNSIMSSSLSSPSAPIVLEDQVFIMLLSKSFFQQLSYIMKEKRFLLESILTIHSRSSFFNQHYYCWFYSCRKCQLLKEGIMMVLGLASLQLQRDPKMSVASFKLFTRIAYSVQISTEGLLHMVIRDPGWRWLRICSRVPRISLSSESPTNQRWKLIDSAQADFQWAGPGNAIHYFCPCAIAEHAVSDHSQLQGKLGNVTELHAQEERTDFWWTASNLSILTHTVSYFWTWQKLRSGVLLYSEVLFGLPKYASWSSGRRFTNITV